LTHCQRSLGSSRWVSLPEISTGTPASVSPTRVPYPKRLKNSAFNLRQIRHL